MAIKIQGSNNYTNPAFVESQDTVGIYVDEYRAYAVGTGGSTSGPQPFFSVINKQEGPTGGGGFGAGIEFSARYGSSNPNKSKIGVIPSGSIATMAYQADVHHFQTGQYNTTRARIDPDGLKFGSDTATVNALDDYEEGTWVPAVRGGSTAGTASYSAQYGTYTKIGRMVKLNYYVQWTALTGTGSLVVSGLPFSHLQAGSPNNYDAVTPGSMFSNFLTFSNHTIVPYINSPQPNNWMQFYTSATNVAWAAVPVDASGAIIASITYFTSQ